jgi:uncharacterized membrane protein
MFISSHGDRATDCRDHLDWLPGRADEPCRRDRGHAHCARCRQSRHDARGGWLSRTTASVSVFRSERLCCRIHDYRCTRQSVCRKSAYMAWNTLIYAVLAAGSFQLFCRRRHSHSAPHTRRNGIISGLMSYGSSWIAIWAFTLAPMSLVSALRETSIVFAIIIGVVFLHERLSLARLASIATTLIGTTVLKLSR